MKLQDTGAPASKIPGAKPIEHSNGEVDAKQLQDAFVAEFQKAVNVGHQMGFNDWWELTKDASRQQRLSATAHTAAMYTLIMRRAAMDYVGAHVPADRDEAVKQVFELFRRYLATIETQVTTMQVTGEFEKRDERVRAERAKKGLLGHKN